MRDVGGKSSGEHSESETSGEGSGNYPKDAGERFNVHLENWKDESRRAGASL